MRKPKVDAEELKRAKPPDDGSKPEFKPEDVSEPLGKVIDYAFNPTREKIREMTVIDRMQGRLLPNLDVVSMGWQYALEIALYRQNPEKYKELHKKDYPGQPNFIDEFEYRTAQWQKSIAGRNLDKATEIALAEIEIRSMEEEEGIGADAWKE